MPRSSITLALCLAICPVAEGFLTHIKEGFKRAWGAIDDIVCQIGNGVDHTVGFDKVTEVGCNLAAASPPGRVIGGEVCSALAEPLISFIHESACNSAGEGGGAGGGGAGGGCRTVVGPASEVFVTMKKWAWNVPCNYMSYAMNGYSAVDGDNIGLGWPSVSLPPQTSPADAEQYWLYDDMSRRLCMGGNYLLVNSEKRTGKWLHTMSIKEAEYERYEATATSVAQAQQDFEDMYTRLNRDVKPSFTYKEMGPYDFDDQFASLDCNFIMYKSVQIRANDDNCVAGDQVRGISAAFNVVVLGREESQQVCVDAGRRACPMGMLAIVLAMLSVHVQVV